MAASAESQRFIPDITISSTVPGNGDANPYGVVFVPSTFPKGGAIAPGDILVSNFNNAPTMENPSGTQGTGTTIVKLTPNVVTPPMQASTFFTSTPIGLTTALGVLERGFVVVGNLPNESGTLSPGSLQLIDHNAHVVATLTDSSLLNGPWDLTIDDDRNHPRVYVSNVLNGTVTRLDLTLSDKAVLVNAETRIAAGYAFRTDPTALVLGPTGLAHDRATDILYVASTADNAILPCRIPPRGAARRGAKAPA
jgi:hypothetical protein